VMTCASVVSGRARTSEERRSCSPVTHPCSPAGHGEGRPLGAPDVRTVGCGRRRRGDTTCGRVLVDIASVCLACFRCLIRMLQVFPVYVAKVDLDISVLWMFIPDVATICFQMLRMLQLFLTYFLCCKH
jgi:hypothetical protein